MFQALQKNAKLSQQKLSKITGFPRTTIQYANERLQKRDFYDIKAIPKLEAFPELPTALLCFENLHPIKLKNLKKSYA